MSQPATPLESIFSAALEKTEPAERAAYLDAACGGDAALRRRVEGLLAAHADAGGFLLHPSSATPTETLPGSRPAPGSPAAAIPDGLLTPCERPGRLGILGGYEVIEVAGRGGMGVVLRAFDPKLNRVVAVKVLTAELAANALAVRRFEREARAAAAVRDEHVIAIHAVEESGGRPFLVMEFVHGRSLQEKLDRVGSLDVREVLRIGMQTARGLAAAHAQGIVHRDVKPSNILLENGVERVKLTDFGLARAAADAELTGAGQVSGTPAYMSPEQAEGRPVDHRSDLFSLGSVMYTMCTGRTAFRADTPVAVLRRVCDATPRPIREVNPDVPECLEDIINRLLAKNPDERFQTAAEVAELLGEHLAAVQRSGQTVRPPARSVPPHSRQKAARRGTSVVFWIVIAVAAAALFPVLLVAGLVAYWMAGSRPVGTPQRSIGPPITATVEGRGAMTRVDPTRDRLAGLLARGRQLTVQTRFDELGPIADEALLLDPESPGALALRATYRAAPGDITRARADAEAALKLNPETHRALIVRSFLDSENGKYDDAIADLTIAIRLEPTDTLAWRDRAGCYFRKGEYRQTITDATRAIELGFPRENAHVDRAAAYACLGVYDKAVADYDAAARLAPGSSAVLVERSAVHAKAGQANKAAEDWARAQELDRYLTDNNRALIPDPPKPPPVKKLAPAEATALAEALAAAERAQAAERYEELLKAADEALQVDPTAPAARSWRARALFQLKRFKEAAKEATDAIPLAPTDPWLRISRGVALAATGAPVSGIADLTVAVTVTPDNSHAWGNRGHAYRLCERYQQAVADLTESLRLKPIRPFLGSRAECFVILGEYEKALADFDKLIEFEPTNAQFLMNRAALRARLRDPDGARKDRETAQFDASLKDAPEVNLPVPVPPVKKDPVSADTPK